MKVFVYYNLHKKCFSVKALEGDRKGLVIAHTNQICLKDVRFKVSQAGRERVLREQRKNVHAGAQGTWVVGAERAQELTAVTYNPYKYNSFVVKDTEQPVTTARFALLDNRRIFAELDN